MIQIYRPPAIPGLEEQVLSCIRSGWWGYGPACHALEKRFTQDRGGWSLATSSGTAALYIAARLLRTSPEDEVIVPAITFVSTAMAFLSAGFRVKVADVDPDTLMVNPETIRPVLSKQTRAVVVVHLYGQKAATAGIRQVCDESGISMIEDCAHRLGLDDTGAPAGDFACYSFNAVKEAAGGEGGFLWGRDAATESRARSISNVGLGVDTRQRSSKLHHEDYQFCEEVGLKLRLQDISATMVNVMLDSRVQLQRKRRDIFRRYDETFRNSSPRLVPLERGPGDSCLMYVLKVSGRGRERLRRVIAAGGVATSVHYPSLSRHPLLDGPDHSCPVAEEVAGEVMTLPCYPDMLPDEQLQVIRTTLGAINEF